jgi:hypothetical protein
MILLLLMMLAGDMLLLQPYVVDGSCNLNHRNGYLTNLHEPWDHESLEKCVADQAVPLVIH